MKLLDHAAISDDHLASTGATGYEPARRWRSGWIVETTARRYLISLECTHEVQNAETAQGVAKLLRNEYWTARLSVGPTVKLRVGDDRLGDHRLPAPIDVTCSRGRFHTELPDVIEPGDAMRQATVTVNELWPLIIAGTEVLGAAGQLNKITGTDRYCRLFAGHIVGEYAEAMEFCRAERVPPKITESARRLSAYIGRERPNVNVVISAEPLEVELDETPSVTVMVLPGNDRLPPPGRMGPVGIMIPESRSMPVTGLGCIPLRFDAGAIAHDAATRYLQTLGMMLRPDIDFCDHVLREIKLRSI